jgi:hypothetical protein
MSLMFQNFLLNRLYILVLTALNFLLGIVEVEPMECNVKSIQEHTDIHSQVDVRGSFDVNGRIRVKSGLDRGRRV